MFGKGVYFADMVSKSANYCHTSQSDPVGLLLLAEVALGNTYVTVSEFLKKKEGKPKYQPFSSALKICDDNIN